MRKRTNLTASTANLIQNLFFYCGTVIVGLLALKTAGVPLTVFTIFGGALALGIGFGSQHLMNNFISGITVLIEQPIKVGDIVDVAGLSGRVMQIGIRATVIRDDAGMSHLIPNSHILENPVTNWHFDDELVAVVVRAGIAYGSDCPLMRKVLLDVAQENQGVVKDPEPTVIFHDFGDNALVFDLLVWMPIQTALERREAASDLRFAIEEKCNENGIVMAFPQRDVHLDVEKAIPIRMEK